MAWRVLTEALGLCEGGAVRTALDRLWSTMTGVHAGEDDPRCRVAFTAALIGLAAKLSKADGVSLKIEADAFERLYHVPSEEHANVTRLFDLAKQDVAGFETYATRIARALEGEADLKRDIFEGLFHVASADGVLHDAEERYLKRVAEIFGLSPAVYRETRALYVHDSSDPYIVLGIAHAAGDADVKAAYKRLVREHHPDRLIGHGVPAEYVDQSTRKLAAINEAYDEIARERGF